MSLLRRFDEFSWRFVPGPLKNVIERESWLKLLTIYVALAILVIYRFFILKRSIFFHSASPVRSGQVESATQLQELMIHLLFFFAPMMLAFHFNRERNP